MFKQISKQKEALLKKDIRSMKKFFLNKVMIFLFKKHKIEIKICK